MRTITAGVLIIVAIMLTSAVWYVTTSLTQKSANPTTHSTPTPSTITSQPTLSPTFSPTPPPQQPQVPTPSVPGFTLQYVDRSYDVPPVYKTDPFTGQSVISQSGYHQDNRTIDVTIQNPFFTSATFADGNVTELRYNVRAKGHFESWDASSNTRGINEIQAFAGSSTDISFNIGGWNVQPGGQIDIQVQSLTGYHYYHPNECMGDYFVTLQKSSWSDTQTITIGTAATPTPTY
jgi:hypothetical protein